MIARIEKFDPVKMKADVKPLGKIKLCGEVQEMPLIIEVPVSFIKAGSFFIRPPYNKGDLAFIIFAEHDIDNIMLTGKEEQTNSAQQPLSLELSLQCPAMHRQEHNILYSLLDVHPRLCY